MNQAMPIEAYNATQNGYTTRGAFFNDSICFSYEKSNTAVWCSVGNDVFFVADTIVSNDWNYGSPASAGMIGLARGSPVWSILFNTTATGYFYQVNYLNGTNWTFADPNYLIQTSGRNYLRLGSGKSDIDVYRGLDTISFSPSTQNSQLFSLSDFSFGVVNMTTGNGTFRSIINSDEALYGFSTNSTFITADFRGLGLPTTSYNIFTNLMDIISIGQVNCLKTQGGLCVLP